tara:strand:+ start:17655 stop:18005 length:351 start_codon:yes stop_codon:yes gene_type:complete
MNIKYLFSTFILSLTFTSYSNADTDDFCSKIAIYAGKAVANEEIDIHENTAALNAEFYAMEAGYKRHSVEVIRSMFYAKKIRFFKKSYEDNKAELSREESFRKYVEKECLKDMKFY